MEATSVIQIDTFQAIFGFTVTIFTIGVAWAKLNSKVEHIDESVKELKTDFRNIRDRFIVVEEKVKTIWKDEFAPSNSPRRLNERGSGILEKSGIKTVIDNKKADFLQELRNKKINNPYDAEQCILKIVNDLKINQDLVESLKPGAFATGTDIDAVLFVGGIYLRDLIFEDLGFKIDDLDK